MLSLAQKMKQLYKLLAIPALRRTVGWALRAIGPGLLALLLLRVVDYGELRAIVGGLGLPWALAALGAVQLMILLRTVRWIEIHRAFGMTSAPFGYQLRLTYATGLAALVLPQILTPFSRFVLLLQDGYHARRAAAGSVLEKALELALFLSVGLFGSIYLASVFGGLLWWAVGLSVVALVGGVGAYVARGRLVELAARVIARLPGAGTEAEPEEVVEEIRSLNRALLARLFGWSLLSALAQATLLYLLSRSIGVELSYPFIAAIWGIIALTALLPISISGIGTREAVLVAAFSAAGESTDAAIALGLLLLAVAALGYSPGAIEWLRRLSAGGRATIPSAVPVGGRSSSG